jgi:serine protease Do
MASPDFDSPVLPPAPPRPTTPPVRRGFLRVLAVLLIITSLAYGIPFTIDRAGYSWEAGRSRAASEALAKLDETGIIERSSALFRMATQVITPAVVNIHTTIEGQPEARGLGSGVIIDKEHGYVVTNEHVIRDADLIMVRIGRSTVVPGVVVGFDASTDLAVVKVKAPIGVAALWGDSAKLEVGDWVLAVGSPFALDRTVTAGIVSALGRHDLGLSRAGAYEDYIQTDAAINPGNSGGPLIDLRGRVIGINTAIFDPEKGQGIGLAISSEIASKVVDQIIRNGKVIRGYIGIVPAPVSPAQAKVVGLPEGQEGAQVQIVRPGSPADRAGIRQGDVIVSIDGKDVTDPTNLRARTFTLPIGSEIPVDLFRDGRKQTVKVTVAELPDPFTLSAVGYGFEAAELPPGQGGGMIVTRVARGSPAAEAGLHEGMRLVAVNRQPVRNRAEFDAVVAAADASRGLQLAIPTPDGGVEQKTITPPRRPRP